MEAMMKILRIKTERLRLKHITEPEPELQICVNILASYANKFVL